MFYFIMVVSSILCQCDLFTHVYQVTSLTLGQLYNFPSVREVTMKTCGKLDWYKTKQSINGGHNSWSVLNMQVLVFPHIFDTIEIKYKKAALNWCTVNPKHRTNCVTWLCLLRFCIGLVYPNIHGDFSGTKATIKHPWCTSTTLKNMGI